MTVVLCSKCESLINVIYETKPNAEICFSAEVQNIGWLGIGFNILDNSKLPNIMDMADFYIANFQETGSQLTVIDDAWGEQIPFGGVPSLDITVGGQDNVIPSSFKSEQANGFTRFSFCRKLATGDAKDHDIVLGEDIFLLAAFGSSQSFQDPNGYHGGNKDFVSVSFVNTTSF
eukprot:CAMPEP_0119119528 /NCGR_PEP_ID=MMETSP1310-20130426/981_1 /TAXON_ID=464262 /ORGANISM="Genus nov. species nov., Strain RCC2339" /LENGTH=173 /DNA_ID=CAMNT_0007108969 /DNA_START=107 /DNA_END=628 /DNA_ORIENTATION=-